MFGQLLEEIGLLFNLTSGHTDCEIVFQFAKGLCRDKIVRQT